MALKANESIDLQASSHNEQEETALLQCVLLPRRAERKTLAGTSGSSLSFCFHGATQSSMLQTLYIPGYLFACVHGLADFLKYDKWIHDKNKKVGYVYRSDMVRAGTCKQSLGRQ